MMQVGDTVERWEQQCDCRFATASGPRVLTEVVEKGDRIFLKGRWVRFACDGCGTPWRPTDPQAGDEA